MHASILSQNQLKDGRIKINFFSSRLSMLLLKADIREASWRERGHTGNELLPEIVFLCVRIHVY